MSNIAEHASTAARCVDINATYFLAKWKFAHEIGTMSKPPTAFLHDPGNKD